MNKYHFTVPHYNIYEIDANNEHEAIELLGDETDGEGFELDCDKAKLVKVDTGKIKTYYFEIPSFNLYEFNANEAKEAWNLLKKQIANDGYLCVYKKAELYFIDNGIKESEAK